MTTTLTWFGHSAFRLDVDDKTALIDPYLTGNPVATVDPNTLSPDVILLSHAHGDHIADAETIAKRSGATIICNFEMGNWYSANGVSNVAQGNPGGTYDAGFLSAKWTLAFHSSSFPDGTYGGQPNGFIIVVGGKKIYFAGDTSLFGDMQLIGEEGIDVAILPIGDLFTMGVDDSIRATKFLNPKVVVPMHYNTFPPIEQDAGAWAERIRNETSAEPMVLTVNGTHTIA